MTGAGSHIQYNDIICALASDQMQKFFPFFYCNLTKICIGIAGWNIIHCSELLNHTVETIEKLRFILTKKIYEIRHIPMVLSQQPRQS